MREETCLYHGAMLSCICMMYVHMYIDGAMYVYVHVYGKKKYQNYGGCHGPSGPPIFASDSRVITALQASAAALLSFVPQMRAAIRFSFCEYKILAPEN